MPFARKSQIFQLKFCTEQGLFTQRKPDEHRDTNEAEEVY